MKKLPILLLSVMAFPSYGQGLLGALNSHQGSLTTPAAGSSSGTKQATPEVKPSSASVTSSSKKCEEDEQTSLPLAYVTSLIQDKNAVLDISHDPRSGTLSVNSPDMIGNCSSMLEWSLNQPEVQGQKAYAIEVKIKKSDLCSDVGCSYKVAKVEKGEFKEYETMVFKPTLKGFEECLQKSGVISKGKVVKDAIYSTPISEKFPGLDATGKLLFQSHGPSSPLIKAKYGKFEHVNGCDYYEAAHPDIKMVMTLSDAENQRLNAEAAKLKNCKIDELPFLTDFIEKNEQFAGELGRIRDNLILEAAKKAAAAIASGKYTEEDLKVIQNFERFIVAPKIEAARGLHALIDELDGDAKKAKQEELKRLLSEINSLNQKPYFSSAHTQKLIQDGRFDFAEAVNSLQLSIENHKRLGNKIENVVVTPEVASQRINQGKQAFKEALEVEKEKFEYRTGQTTGKAAHYNVLANRMKQNIETRSNNYKYAIYEKLQDIQQPNGYCFKYWRNTTRCVQETYEDLQAWQGQLAHYNKVDAERAAEYEALAKQYHELENQGRRYLAAQNGEAPPAEQDKNTAQAPQADGMAPVKRNREEGQNGVYSFEFQQQQALQQQQLLAQQQAQMMPQQYQQPMYPNYQQNMFQQQTYGYQQQQPFLGQQAFGFNGQGGGTYNFNWNGGAQNQMYGQQPMYGQNMYQQPVQGFGQMPYQSYGQYNMYGFR